METYLFTKNNTDVKSYLLNSFKIPLASLNQIFRSVM